MAYVKRGADGRIIAVFADAQADAGEQLPGDHPELLAFLARGEGPGGEMRDALAYLAGSDLEMIRVLEDLIDVLIQRKVIQMTDFADAAQAKLVQRRTIRGQIAIPDPLVDDEPMF